MCAVNGAESEGEEGPGRKDDIILTPVSEMHTWDHVLLMLSNIWWIKTSALVQKKAACFQHRKLCPAMRVIKDRNEMKRGRGKWIVWRRQPGGVSHETAAAALLDRCVRDSSTVALLRGPRLPGGLVGLEPLQPSATLLTTALPHTWFTKLLICSWGTTRDTNTRSEKHCKP